MVLSNPWVALGNVLLISFTRCDNTILIMTSHMASHKRGNVSKFAEASVEMLIITGIMVMARLTTTTTIIIMIIIIITEWFSVEYQK